LAFVLGFAGSAAKLFSKGRQPAGFPPFRASGWVVYWDKVNSLQAARDHGDKLEEISIFAADFDESYQLTVHPEAAEALQELKGTSLIHRPRLLMSVVNDVKAPAGSFLKNPDCIHTILSSREKRSAHIEQLLQLSADTDGIEIDYESLYLKDRDAFSFFIRDLADKLHQRGQWLSVDVEPKTADVLKDREGAMDWKALGQYADNVKVMAYLYHYPSGDPGPLAPPDWVVEIARFAVSQIPAEKLSIALTMEGCDWGKQEHGKSLNYLKIMDLAEKYNAVSKRDKDSATPYFHYTENGIDHQVWFEDKESLTEKVRRLQETGILHIALWYLGSGDPAFLKGLTLP